MAINVFLIEASLSSIRQIAFSGTCAMIPLVGNIIQLSVSFKSGLSGAFESVMSDYFLLVLLCCIQIFFPVLSVTNRIHC